MQRYAKICQRNKKSRKYAENKEFLDMIKILLCATAGFTVRNKKS